LDDYCYRSDKRAGQSERDQRPSLFASDPEHIKVFANKDAAEKWFEENDPDGVACEYEVLE
jgi:hypothetical protein